MEIVSEKKDILTQNADCYEASYNHNLGRGCGC
jgi:hypothetical protein